VCAKIVLINNSYHRVSIQNPPKLVLRAGYTGRYTGRTSLQSLQPIEASGSFTIPLRHFREESFSTTILLTESRASLGQRSPSNSVDVLLRDRGTSLAVKVALYKRYHPCRLLQGSLSLSILTRVAIFSAAHKSHHCFVAFDENRQRLYDATGRAAISTSTQSISRVGNLKVCHSSDHNVGFRSVETATNDA